MREYGSIKTQYWVTGTGMEIIQCGLEYSQVALYLISCPSSNMIGLYPIKTFEISRHTNIELARIKPILEKLIELDFIEYDFERNFVWVKKQIKHQIGNSIKIIKGRKIDSRVIKINAILKEYWNFPLARRFYECYSSDYNLKSPDSIFTQNISQDAAGAKAPVAQPQKTNPKPQGTYQPPKDFQPTPEMLAWAAKNHPHVDVLQQTEKFKNHTFNRLISDWNARWKNWIIDNRIWLTNHPVIPAVSAAKKPDVGVDYERETANAAKSEELIEFENLMYRRNTYMEAIQLRDAGNPAWKHFIQLIDSYEKNDSQYFDTDGIYIPNPSFSAELSKKSSTESGVSIPTASDKGHYVNFFNVKVKHEGFYRM